MQNYRNLIAWQKAHSIALGVHRLTQSWTRKSLAGLIGQVHRSSLSIPSNLAEGTGRAGDKEFAKFVQIALGSAIELEYQLHFAADAGIARPGTTGPLQERIEELKRILWALLKRLRGDGA